MNEYWESFLEINNSADTRLSEFQPTFLIYRGNPIFSLVEGSGLAVRLSGCSIHSGYAENPASSNVVFRSATFCWGRKGSPEKRKL